MGKHGRQGGSLYGHNLLILVTFGYAAGATLSLHTSSAWTHSQLSLLTFFLLTAGLGASCTTRKTTTLLLLTIAFFALGYQLMAKERGKPGTTNHIATRITEKTTMTLIGTVHSMIESQGKKSRLILAVEEMCSHGPQSHGTCAPTSGKVLLSIRDQLDTTIRPGSLLMIVATISPLRPRHTPGTFDYANYLAAKDIYVTGWIARSDFIEPIYRQGFSLGEAVRYFPEQLRQQFSSFLVQSLAPESAALYQALLLGYRGNIPKRTLEKFKTGGVLHLLAISGLHLSLLASGMAAFVLFCLKRSQWLLLHTYVPALAVALTIPTLFAYSLIAGMNLPVFRALVMAVLAAYALFIHRFKSMQHLLAAAAFVILTVHPIALNTASFQLSFAAVAGIVLLTQKIGPWWLAVKRSNPLKGYLLLVPMGLLVSTAATMATLPIMLVHFGRFSLIGPVVNLLIEPLLCFWALPLGLIALPLSLFAPEAATAVLHLGALGFQFSDTILSIGSQIPVASLWTITPSWLEIITYYALLSLPFVPCLTRRTKLVCQCIGFPMLLFSFTFTLWHRPSRPETMIHFIDVGHGSSTLLELRDGHNCLVDAGGRQSADFNVGEAVVAPFLRKRRIWKLDAVIISHPHSDHYNGIPFLLQQYAPERLYINGQQTKEWRYQKLLRDAAAKNVRIQALQKGQFVHQSPKDTLLCLGTAGYPEAQAFSTNDQSLVILLRTDDDFSVLLPGDITKAAEQLLVRNNLPRATVLVAPHHGSITSTTPAFLQAVAPRFIVVSSGYSRRNTFPAPQHTARWKQVPIPFATTALAGTIRCTIHDTTLHIQDFQGKPLFSQTLPLPPHDLFLLSP